MIISIVKETQSFGFYKVENVIILKMDKLYNFM